MPRSLSFIILIAAPLILTVSLVIVGIGAHAVGLGLGSTTSSASVVLAGLVFWLLHAGYLLAPWLFASERRSVALWLMVPIGLVGLGVATVLYSKLLPDHLLALEGPLFVGSIVWGTGVLFAYLAPIVVMLIGEAPSESAPSSSQRELA